MYNFPIGVILDSFKKSTKDGIKIKAANVEHMFGIGDIPADFKESDYCIETPLGTGNVDFNRYLKALEDIGYEGFLTIERETGSDPTADIHIAAQYLREVIAKNQ